MNAHLSATEPSRLPVWAAFLVVVAAVVAQGAVLQSDWVLDDALAIRDNADVRVGVSGIPAIFGDGFVPGASLQGAWRPLTLASFAIDASLWSRADGALSPFGFHLTNLLLHALCSVLILFAVMRRAPGRMIVALGTAVCFAVHPMHTGTVSALWGRADLLALLFSLLALRAWDAYDGKDLAWLPVTLLLWFMALLAKEAAIGLPLALLALDLVRGGRFRPRAIGYVAFGVVFALFLVVWPGPATLGAELPAQGVFARAALGLVGVLRIALRLLIPVGYRADHGDEASAEFGFDLGIPEVASLVLVVSASLVSIGALRRGRGTLLAGGWLAAVVLGLAAAVAGPAGISLELRFAYVVGAPLFVVAGVAFEILAGTARRNVPSKAFATAGLVAGLTAAACLALLSRAEAESWRDDDAVHERILAESPGHVGALVRQGRLLRETADLLAAEAATMPTVDTARRENPDLKRLLDARRVALARARGWLERAVDSPSGQTSAAAWRELGSVRLAQGLPAGALRAFTHAQQLDPVLMAQQNEEQVDESRFTRHQLDTAAGLYHEAGVARGALGEREAHAEALRMAATLAPDNVEYLAEAGVALCALRRWGEGLELLQAALQKSLIPERQQQLEALIEQQRDAAEGMAMQIYRKGQEAFNRGDRREAVVQYEAAFGADPGLIDAWIQAARIRGVWFGDYTRAHGYLNQAERIAARAPEGADAARIRLIEAMRKTLQEAKQKDDAELAAGGG